MHFVSRHPEVLLRLALLSRAFFCTFSFALARSLLLLEPLSPFPLSLFLSLSLYLSLSFSLPRARAQARLMRVEFLLKTESGYLRDAEVTLFTLANP